ncbi:MAG: hypothetical protein ACXAAM_05035 [Candidatus Heimdallarchaeaceae archaeon]
MAEAPFVVNMTKYCYIHTTKESFKECENCGNNICHDCSEKYWHTNAISAMFSPQKQTQQEMTYCPRCLRKAKIRNTIITSFLLIVILGIIIFTILFSRLGF